MRRNVSSLGLVGLVGLLSEWALVDTEVSRQDSAEQLSMWLGPVDAIRLSAAHQAIKATALQARPLSRQTRASSLDEAFRHLRTSLAPGFKEVHDKVTPEPEFAFYRQQYLAHQHRMDARLPPFRDHCRQVLSQTSVRLRQLAELDAALETILGAREKALLSRVTALLERRFEYVRANQPAHWLATFGKNIQEAGLAELNFRLEPILGLVEALSNET